MLTFTTTEPGFMGSAGSDPFVPIKEPIIKCRWRGVYIHSKAQDIAGYDIPVIVDGELDYKEEQDCVLALKDQSLDCVLIAWRLDETTATGLILAKDDDDGIAYAKQCQSEKRKHQDMIHL